MHVSTFVCCQPSNKNQHNDTSMVNRRYHGTPWSRQRSVSHLLLSFPISSVCQWFPKLMCVSPMVTLRRPVFTCFGLFLFICLFFLNLFLNVSFYIYNSKRTFHRILQLLTHPFFIFSLNVFHCKKRHIRKQEVCHVIIFKLLFPY